LAGGFVRAIRIFRTPTVVTVWVDGDLDQAVAMKLHDVLLDLIVVQASRAIIVDLASLDGDGVLGGAVLAGAKSMALERESELVFSSRSPAVAAALRSLTG
jgi:anti-anti-sigma regulatory factor